MDSQATHVIQFLNIFEVVQNKKVYSNLMSQLFLRNVGYTAGFNCTPAPLPVIENVPVRYHASIMSMNHDWFGEIFIRVMRTSTPTRENDRLELIRIKLETHLLTASSISCSFSFHLCYIYSFDRVFFFIGQTYKIIKLLSRVDSPTIDLCIWLSFLYFYRSYGFGGGYMLAIRTARNKASFSSSENMDPPHITASPAANLARRILVSSSVQKEIVTSGIPRRLERRDLLECTFDIYLPPIKQILKKRKPVQKHEQIRLYFHNGNRGGHNAQQFYR